MMGISPPPQGLCTSVSYRPLRRDRPCTYPWLFKLEILDLGKLPLREVRIKMGARCDLHQPPGVTDVSVLEGRLICTHGRGVWEFPGAPPLLAGFSGTILGVERIEPSTLIKNRW